MLTIIYSTRTPNPFCVILVLVFVLALACCTSAKNVTFNSTFRVGDRQKPVLTGVLTVPEGNGTSPAVVLLHGGSGLVRKAYLSWVNRLIEWGYVVLQVDSFSQRNLTMANNYDSIPYIHLIKMRSQDAHDARNYLAALANVDRNRIGVIGWSQGGTVVNYIVSKNTSPNGAFRAAVSFYPQCIMKVRDINTPLLVLAGEKDNICHAYLCRSMLPLKGASHELIFKVYKEAHHAFDFAGADAEIAWDSRYGFRYFYHPGAAEDAVVKVREFFDKHLN